MSALHSKQTNNHRLEAFVYANQAARLAATGFTVDDFGKVAYQEDTDTYWRLENWSPISWCPLTGNVGDFRQIIFTIAGELITPIGVGPFPTHVYMRPSDVGTIEEFKLSVNIAPTATPIQAKLYKNGSSIMAGTTDIALSALNGTSSTFTDTTLTNDDTLNFELVQGDVSAQNLVAYARYSVIEE